MKKTKAAAHFDEIASKYDFYKKKNKIYYNSLKSAVKSFVTKKNPKIVDIGCGTGDVLFAMKPHKGLGTDISSEMIKLAKKKYSSYKKLTFRNHNIEESPIKFRADYILFNDVIEHISDQESAIKNLSKSMSIGTTLIFSMANPHWEPLLGILEKLQLKMPEGPHYRISEKELLVLLKKYNLRVVNKIVFLPRIKIPVFRNFGLMYVYSITKVLR